MYLHAIVNRGLGKVIWTEIWSSADNGISWQHMGEKAKFPGPLHNGYAQCWSWDYDPDDGWVYVVSTGFQRDRGIILRRVRPEDIGDMWKYSGWGYANGRWAWDNEPTPITPGGETWGELCLRRLQSGEVDPRRVPLIEIRVGVSHNRLANRRTCMRRRSRCR